MDYLDSLQVFCNVVEKGNFVRTAETMGTSSSYISKAIASLEQRLQCKLFQRSTRHMELTEAGGFFYQKLLPLLAELQQAETQVNQMVNRPEGVLRISGPTAMASLFEQQRLIEGFLSQYPDISIDLELDDRSVDVIMEGFELVLRVAVKLPDSNLVAKPLHHFSMVVCCSPDYLERCGKPLRLTDLSEHNCLLFKPASPDNHWYLEQRGERKMIPVQGNFCSNNIEIIRRSTISGSGIGLLPEVIIKQELDNGQLIHLFPSYRSMELTFYALYPDRHWTPLKTRLFIEYMQQNAIRET